MTLSRRHFLGAGAFASRWPVAPPSAAENPIARVVVVGGGYGGATAAKYIRNWDAAASR